MSIGDERQAAASEDFRIGRVTSRTFEALFSNPATFLGLAGIFAVPPLLLSLYAVKLQAAANAPSLADAGRVILTSLLVSSAAFVFASLMQAALAQATLSWLGGEKPS